MTDQYNHNLSFLRDLPVAKQVSLYRARWKCFMASQFTVTSGVSAFGLKLARSFDPRSEGRLLMPVPSIAEEALVVEFPTQSDIVFALAAIYSMKTGAWTLSHSPKREMAIATAKRDISNLVPYPDSLLVESRLGIDAPVLSANQVLSVDTRSLSFLAREQTVAAALAGRRSIQAHGIYSRASIRNPKAGAVVNTEKGALFDDRPVSITSDGCAFCARESRIGTSCLFADCAPLAEAKGNMTLMTFPEAFGLPAMLEDVDTGNFKDLFTQFCSYLNSWARALSDWSKEIREIADIPDEDELSMGGTPKAPSSVRAGLLLDADYAEVSYT